MWHFAKNLGLLLCSLLFLPINTIVVVAAYAWTKATGGGARGTQDGERKDAQAPVTVLVTGVNMAKGLSLARLFHRRGHRVIGADWHSFSLGRVSSCVDRFYKLPHPTGPAGSVTTQYLDTFLEMVQKEDVDLWVSVSDVTTAVEDAAAKEVVEARTGIKCIQPSVEDIGMLHAKDSFMEYTQRLGLDIPTTEVVNNKDEIIEFLRKHGGLEYKPGAKRYMVKPIGVDDVARFDKPIVPLSSSADTIARLDKIPFSAETPYIIQQFIDGDEFCTHSLIVRGHVRAFVACPSAEVLMHYSALPADTPLSQAMLDFTAKQAEALGGSFTGHLSFDFLVEDRATEKAADQIKLYPIECNPRVHTATLFFNDTPKLIDEYLAALAVPSSTESIPKPPLAPTNPSRYYWIAQDLVELVLLPMYLSLTGDMSLKDLHNSTNMFLRYVTYWRDGTFEVSDPWPFWWMCHVFWPVQFGKHLVKGSWKKINVSTGKMFKA